MGQWETGLQSARASVPRFKADTTQGAWLWGLAMKRRDGGAAHPFDAAVIPRRLTRRRCLLEEFWKPSPLGLASISWLHARATRPPHALNFAPGLCSHPCGFRSEMLATPLFGHCSLALMFICP
ncbi:hypothetical protein CLIM01_04896 [Colletotrichum limetticola]|uniref:Uncharacterized protein n=1 Tax=Colletotrichum limetticola TaxID=1209924 RepID=A0ABQ9Q221_9PEZI|nr:hypothetical protein CLIM01_04896 [Colletotrichum limetticola]